MDQQDSGEKTFEVNGTPVKAEVQFSKEFKTGLAIAPHVPVVIPYAGTKKQFFVTLQPQDREGFLVEYSSELPSEELSDLVETSLESIQLKFSPDKEHLIYRRKTETQDTLVTIHYLNKKHPFISSYYTQEVAKETPAWEKIPNAREVAIRIIADTSKLYQHMIDFWCAVPKEEQFWELLKMLPPENELDYLVLEKFQWKKFTVEHINRRCSDWATRSPRWKAAVAARLNAIYQQTAASGKAQPFQTMEYTINVILDSSRDVTMKNEYLAFVVENFGNDLFGSLGMLLQSEDPVEKAFLKARRQYILTRCLTILEENDPVKTTEIVFLSSLLKDKKLQYQANEKMVRQWPAYPTEQYIFRYNLSQKQKDYLIKKAIGLITNPNDSYQACELLHNFADCATLKKLQAQYPDKITLRYGCE